MTIKEVHDYIQLILRKERAGHRSHEEIDLALDRAQMERFVDLYQTFAVTQKMHDDLLPFKERLVVNEFEYSSNNTGGSGPYGEIRIPANYEYFRSLYKYTKSDRSIQKEEINAGVSAFTGKVEKGKVYKIDIEITAGADLELKYNGKIVLGFSTIETGTTSHTVEFLAPDESNKSFNYNLNAGMANLDIREYIPSSIDSYPIHIIDEDELAIRLQDEVVKPTAAYPIAVEDRNTDGEKIFEIYPQQGVWGQLRYLKRPAKPNYVYTLSGRTETHDAATSTDLEWSDSAVGPVINLALQKLGVTLDDANIYNYTQKEEAQ